MKVLVAGAGGFIGGHLVKRLLDEGHEVRAVDIKSWPQPGWWQLHPEAENRCWDLRESRGCTAAVKDVDHVYNLACDMGGMGFIANHRAMCMLSVLINTNLLRASVGDRVTRYFFASSACVYPAGAQDSVDAAPLKESDAYPADPEDGYGWEKLFSERMCRHFTEDFGLQTRVARCHNVYGSYCTWRGGREKAPAAICRKVAEGIKAGAGMPTIEVWGDGRQTRSFMYVQDAIEGTVRLMASAFEHPLNIGSAQTVTIDQLVDAVETVAGVRFPRRYDTSAPQGVRRRSSDNTLCRDVLGWEPTTPLSVGLVDTYRWIVEQVDSPA